MNERNGSLQSLYKVLGGSELFCEEGARVEGGEERNRVRGGGRGRGRGTHLALRK